MARTEVSFVNPVNRTALRAPMHPVRRPLAAAVAAALGVLMLHWPAAHGMSLGVPRVNSALGQPLDLAIPAQSQDPNELTGECLRLLPAPDSDIPTLTAGRILVERDGLLTTLRIRSLDPIYEPAFRVVLEAGCQRRMQREYVLLLDPPPLRDVAPAGAAAAAPIVVPGAPAPIKDIELGDADIRAVRGRPLLMRVPVRGPAAAQLTAECVRTVADDRLPTLANTSARLLDAGTAGAALQIISGDPLADQVVRVVVEVGCERPIRRQFDVLVETPSPIYENLAASAPAVAAAPARPKPAVPRAVRPRPTPTPVAPAPVAPPLAPPAASKAPADPPPAAAAPPAPPPVPATAPAPDRLVLAAPEEAPAATPGTPTPAPTQTDELVKRLDELATEVKRLRTELDAANARNAALNEKLASSGSVNLGWAVAAGVSILFAGLLWMSNRRPRPRRERADDHDVEGPMTRIVGRRTQAASHDSAAQAASAAAAATVAGAGTHLATNLTDVRSHHDIQVTEMGDEEAIRELYSGYVSKQSSPSTVMRGDLQLPAAGRGEYGTRFGDETGATRMTMPMTTQIAVDIDLSQDDGYGVSSPVPPGQTVTRPLELDLELDLPLDESLTRGKTDKGGKAD
jgi:hypothetical protein